MKPRVCAWILLIALLCSACNTLPGSDFSGESKPVSSAPDLFESSERSSAESSVKPILTEPPTSSPIATVTLKPTATATLNPSPTITAKPTSTTTPKPSTVKNPVNDGVFDYIGIPEYSGAEYHTVNDNKPYFTKDELTLTAFEFYSSLDPLGRCGMTCANICKEIMPTEPRGEIGSVKPTGWQYSKYDFVDGKYLYNRCHLIGFQLSGENANRSNLVTGTRYMNTAGMLPFENMVADYVKETSCHVLYRVTPVFVGKELVCRGVLMEAQSIEDGGEGISFCVFCYNVQPGVKINYLTGENSANTIKVDKEQTSTAAPKATVVPVVTEQPLPTKAPDDSAEHDYILNIGTKKFHYSDCESVGQMSEKNKQERHCTRRDIIAEGYQPCQKCNP